MDKQPIPRVTDNDVKRIAIREFGENKLSEVLSILRGYGKQDWNQPSPRVHIAVMKLANGDINKLVEIVKAAIDDYRDVLAQAEYPRYSREIGFNEVSKEYKRKIIDEDWEHYSKWLKKDNA